MIIHGSQLTGILHIEIEIIFILKRAIALKNVDEDEEKVVHKQLLEMDGNVDIILSFYMIFSFFIFI